MQGWEASHTGQKYFISKRTRGLRVQVYLRTRGNAPLRISDQLPKFPVALHFTQKILWNMLGKKVSDSKLTQM